MCNKKYRWTGQLWFYLQGNLIAFIPSKEGDKWLNGNVHKDEYFETEIP